MKILTRITKFLIDCTLIILDREKKSLIIRRLSTDIKENYDPDLRAYTGSKSLDALCKRRRSQKLKHTV